MTWSTYENLSHHQESLINLVHERESLAKIITDRKLGLQTMNENLENIYKPITTRLDENKGEKTNEKREEKKEDEKDINIEITLKNNTLPKTLRPHNTFINNLHGIQINNTNFLTYSRGDKKYLKNEQEEFELTNELLDLICGRGLINENIKKEDVKNI